MCENMTNEDECSATSGGVMYGPRKTLQIMPSLNLSQVSLDILLNLVLFRDVKFDRNVIISLIAV